MALTDYPPLPKSAPTRASVRDVIKGVVALMEWDAKKSGVAIVMDAPEGEEAVLVNADHLRQILINLIANATQAMTGGGTLTIRARREEHRYRIEVSDTGPGIPSSDLGKIFAPFYTTREAGTGLGLAIVRRLVEEMGGAIEVGSQPDQGTTFRFSWPNRNGAIREES